MYVACFFIGVGQALSMNTGIALIVKLMIIQIFINFQAEVIGQKGSRGAIVFGFYSFFDKVLNGIVIFLIMVYLNFEY